MSCDCKCGCDGKYSGGVKCYPLIVNISHNINLDYTCQAFHVPHPSSPSAVFEGAENCEKVYSYTKDKGGIRTSRYVFALSAKSGPGSSCEESSERATVVFSVSPPKRGWHNKGDGNDVSPFTKYDGTNPSCSIKCNARMKSESDAAEYYFEATSNPDTDNHLAYPPSLRRIIVVEVSNGNVSVEFRRA